MPILIAAVALGVLLGIFAPRRVALALTGLAAALTVLVFVWAVADGKGDDPWWLIPIGIGGAALALTACHVLSAHRSARSVNA